MSTLSAPAPILFQLISPFMSAVRDVFKKMAQVEVTVQKPRLKDQHSPSYGVSSIIGFSGDVTGSVVIRFSNEAAAKLVEAFTGMAIEPDSADFVDAIGELANMIAGSAKTSLGGASNISLPSVIIGSNYTLSNMSNAQCIVIPCSSPCGEFAVEVCIKHALVA